MCPDRQILSVYFDGELGSPWKEKLEKHMETCLSCQEHLAAYRFTRQKLSAATLDKDTLECAQERILQKIGLAVKPKRRFWAGSITLPIPLASAAGLFMIVTLAALIILRQPVKVVDPPLAGLEMQEMIPASDMASFFQYLGNDNSTDMVIIRLPNKAFRDAGEPRMFRAADYSHGGILP
jgi:hypothetical protein